MSTILLALVGVFFAYDIYVDLSANGPDSHLWLEFVFFILILMRLIYEIRTFSKLTEELSEEKTRTANLSGQLNEYISSHFEQWDLSKSEKEIAWLMLKGYSFKEIAVLRQVKEKTVRQQASTIYTKSGSNNRNEFNAFFYEELIGGLVE